MENSPTALVAVVCCIVPLLLYSVGLGSGYLLWNKRIKVSWEKPIKPAAPRRDASRADAALAVSRREGE
jgi:hypothetical protein